MNNQSVLENNSYKIIIENGVIRSFYEKEKTTNLVDAKGHCGSVGFTWESEDVRLQSEKRSLTPYEEVISKHFHLPLLQNVSGGGFCGEAVVRHIGRADAVQVKTPDGTIYSLPTGTPLTHIPLQAFGLYTVTPMLGGKRGLNTTLWYGKDYVKLYQKACEAIQKPYHNDENLCEGGCFLWALLNYMRITGDRQFESLAREELAIVMGERDYVARKTIVPHPTETYAAYHIHRSGRIQEQVFGASILLETYLLFKENRYLEFSISALQEMMEHDMIGGKLLNGSGADYTKHRQAAACILVMSRITFVAAA